MATKLDIQSLPNELLLHIYKCLALQPRGRGYRSLSEFKETKLALLQLSKTTRKLALAANEILYETVIITTPSSLVSLLHTVSQNKDAASHVKHIACLLTLRARVNDEVHRAWLFGSRKVSDLTPAAVRSFQLAGLMMDDDISAVYGNKPSLFVLPEHAGERIFAALLALLPSLKSIVYQLPSTRVSWLPGSHPPARYLKMSTILESVLADRELGPTALQKLTCVTMQPIIHGEWEPRPGIRCDTCIGLLKAPNLTTLVAYNDVGGWQSLPHTLKDLRLFGSLKPDTLSTVCDIPTLERLTIQPDRDHHDEADVEDDVFNAALVKRASTLKYLELVTMCNHTLMSSYGPLKYLHCLSELQALEELRIEIFALLADSTNLDGAVENLLPRSLRSLTLWERWPSSDPVHGLKADDLMEYRERFYNMLTGIAQSCATGRLPLLRRVSLDRYSRWIEPRRPVQSVAMLYLRTSYTMLRLKKTFADAGVVLEFHFF